MLVVLLILMVATASAAMSVSTSQGELRAAGHDRRALQTRYASEAAIMTSITWLDMLGDSGQFVETWEAWDGDEAGEFPPIMSVFGEPEIDQVNRHHASRINMVAQMALQRPGDMWPLHDPVATTGTSGAGGTGGAGGAAAGPTLDDLGSFGPRQAYGLDPGEGYVVDITDCSVAPSGLTPGAPVGGGPGSLAIVQFYCVVTAHSRLFPQSGAPAAANRAWTLSNPNGGDTTYTHNRFISLHDSRATIVTPEMIVPRD